jgi:hypothetical protein
LEGYLLAHFDLFANRSAFAYVVLILWFTLQGMGEAEEGAGKGIVDKSSTATTAIAQREAIRKREKGKRALVSFLVKNSPLILFVVGRCATCKY